MIDVQIVDRQSWGKERYLLSLKISSVQRRLFSKGILSRRGVRRGGKELVTDARAEARRVIEKGTGLKFDAVGEDEKKIEKNIEKIQRSLTVLTIT